MKKWIFFLIVCLMLSGLKINAQQTRIEYLYNKNGARISRKVIILQRDMQKQMLLPSENKEKPLSSDLLEDKEIRIYPNPTQGSLRIDIISSYPTESLGVNCSFLLYDATGKLMLQHKSENSSNVLDLADYPDGWYILEIILGKDKKQYKIIKE